MQAIADYTAEQRAKHHPAAILFDLTDLNYVWGDGPVSQLLVPMWREDQQQAVVCPTCLVAQGRSKQALQNLLDACGVLRFIDTKVIGSVPEAMGYLRLALQT